MTAPITFVALLALIGAVAGSFVNLVSVRLPRGEPVAFARSKTECCGRPLNPRELVPIASWLFQRGLCTQCGQRISVRHPLVELAGAGIGVWAGLASGSTIEATLTAILGWQLLLLALIDADTFWLPDRLTLPLLGSGLVAATLLPDRSLLAALIGAVVGFLALALIRLGYRALRKREGLGGGDPILFAALGAWVGWTGLPSVLLWACAAGLSWVGAKMIVRRGVQADQPMPFGPFLVIGAWLTWLYGPIGLA